MKDSDKGYKGGCWYFYSVFCDSKRQYSIYNPRFKGFRVLLVEKPDA